MVILASKMINRLSGPPKTGARLRTKLLVGSFAIYENTLSTSTLTLKKGKKETTRDHSLFCIIYTSP